MNKEHIIINIKGLIANGRTEDALTELLGFLKQLSAADNYLNEAILLSSRFNKLQKEIRIGVVSHGEETISKNQINFSLLEILNEIKSTELKKSKSIDEFSIQNAKNVVSGSNISAGGNIHIGDVEHHMGSGDTIKGDKIVNYFVNIGDKVQADEKRVEALIKDQSKIKILFLAANPLNSNPLRLDKEMREIEAEIVRSKHRDKFEFIKFSAVRVKDLQQALLDISPHFVHFSGHGTTEGIALLNNQTDKAEIVKSEPLANLFKLFSNDVACVFLNSCYSESQARQIRRFITNVIGMNNAVNDETAIVFATSFYQVIGSGREIRFAFEFAKNSIDLNNVTGSNIPIYLD